MNDALIVGDDVWRVAFSNIIAPLVKTITSIGFPMAFVVGNGYSRNTIAGYGFDVGVS